MRRRVFVVYNPRSSRADVVREEVLEAVRELPGWMVAKFEVREGDFDGNVRRLAMLLNAGDLVMVAGGDGTASIALNAIVRSGKDVTFTALPYGNFNDMAGMLGVKSGTTVRQVIDAAERDDSRNLFALEVKVDERIWRYAASYATLGLLAEATQIFDEPKMRKSLKAKRRGPLYSLVRAVWWYFWNKGRRFLPVGQRKERVQAQWNGELLDLRTTDYIAMNGSRMAQLMKSKRSEGWWQDEQKFGSTTQRLGGFWRMMRFGLESITSGVPVEASSGDVLEFAQASEVEIQVEGEFAKLSGVRKVEVCKYKKPVRVLTL